jgi:exodeoxyribonuclease V alpha subunit
MHPKLVVDASLEKLSGIVKRITFHSPESGFTVLKVSPFARPADEVAVVVHQSKVFAGATMDFYGEWGRHPQHGEQFKATKVVERKPATAHALEKYLGSGLIKGVGPVTASRIVKHFGKDTLDVFENHMERLVEVEGIAQLKLQMIAKAWQEHQEIRHVMMFLQSHNISTLFAVKIYKTYGNAAVELIQENPYRLAADIYGIGFLSADKVALSLGIAPDAPQRIRAAIDHVLQGAREEGHCYLTREQILEAVTELLALPPDNPTAGLLDQLAKEDALKTRQLPDADGQVRTCYYAHSLFYDENYLANTVRALAAVENRLDRRHLKETLDAFCGVHTINLSDEQEGAVLGIVTRRLSVLTGGPGCGKTTTTRALVGLLQMMSRKVLLAAPTGRAAQRMSEVIGWEAKTIHRLLEFDPVTGGFKRKEDDPLDCDFLIVDECSMLDVHLSASLLRAVPKRAQVVLIGDSDQLPSVGAGNVLKDIIDSGQVTVFRLTRIFRQAQESLIIRYAHQINQGQMPKIDSPFHKPALWGEKIDCLFIDSEEATQEQIRFIGRVKRLAAAEAKTYELPEATPQALAAEEEVAYAQASAFTIPDKFRHVDLEKLQEAHTRPEELKEVLKRVHPWSSLHYGLSATDMIRRLYTATVPKYAGRDAEIQVLTPMTKGSLGTASLNQLLQEATNPPRPGKAQLTLGSRLFRVGDRVIQKRNNYDLGVFNGDIGRIADIDNEEMTCTVTYQSGKESKAVVYQRESLAELELAYAITIHKSQGSEFPVVIIPLTTQHFSMLFRNLVYTAITRAKKLVVFVGTRSALSLAVGKQNTATRQTALKLLIREGVKI